MAMELFFEDVSVGDEIPELVKSPITNDQLIRYAGASGDFNPLHTDDEVGKAMGLGGRIAHGMLIMGFIGQAITDWVPKRCLRKLSARFVGISRPGDIIRVTGIVEQKHDENGQHIISCKVVARGADEEVKLSGTFEAALPSKRSQDGQ